MSEIRGQCPAHDGDTAGTDSYFWNADKLMGHCKSCGLRVWDYKGDLWGKRDGGTKFKINEEWSDPPPVENEEWSDPPPVENETPVGEYEGWRGITKDTMEYFGVVTKDGKLMFKYPSGGHKVRLKGEKSFYAEGLKGDELFGMNLFPAGCSRKVTITEGEMDAMSGWQMLYDGSKYTMPFVSVPGATPSGKLWDNCKDWLDSFKEIILSVDNDDPGKKLAQKISLMFPGKVKIMLHGKYKDANDFLMNDEGQAYKDAWFNPKRHRPEGILVDAEDYLKLYDESPDFEYFPTGVKDLDDKILGINKGYFTVLQAPTGVGKTEVMRYLEWQCLKHSNYKFAYMHLEESRLRSVLGLVSYELNDNLTLKKFIEEKGREADVKEAITTISESERMVQFSYSPEDGYESLLDQVKYLVAAFDVDYVFFEPIQDLVDGVDKESKLADLSTRLGTLASQLGVGLVTIAHQNKDGDTMYATMIGKKAAFELVLQRDQEAEDLTERNRTYIKVGRKNRVGLGNGPAGALDFDHESYTLKPVEGPVEPVVDKKDDF